MKHVTSIPTYTLLPQKALQLAAELMGKGDKEGRKPDEWKGLSIEEQLDHAIHHITQYLQGERDEQHLVNASCRILMASEKESLNKKRLKDSDFNIPDGVEGIKIEKPDKGIYCCSKKPTNGIKLPIGGLDDLREGKEYEETI